MGNVAKYQHGWNMTFTVVELLMIIPKSTYLSISLPYFSIYHFFLLTLLPNNYTVCKLNMEIKGRIIHVLPLQEGVSKAGNPWKKQEYVLETEEQYPRKVCFNLFGDKVDQYPAAIGEDVVVSFDLESREFNGRWYTDVRAWKIEKSAPVAQGVPDMPPMPNDIAPFPPAPAAPDLAPSPTDDLPF